MTRHLCEIRLRWGDMDAYQHVNNVSWAVYVQEARAQMFAFRLRGTPGESLLGSLVVARARFFYRRPLIARPQPLVAHTWISELRAAAITVECELRDDETTEGPVYCAARTVLAPFDFSGARLRRLTPEETAALSDFSEQSEPAPGGISRAR
jgi:acyl-CoA thioester hydrolase